jgi:hypothetical protein
MSPATRDSLLILRYAGYGIAYCIGTYYAIDGLWIVNGVGLLHRQGFPWSSLPIWITVGAVGGLAWGARLAVRMRRHEASFQQPQPVTERLPAEVSSPELIAADDAGLWNDNPSFCEMPLLRSRSDSIVQEHDVDHRMTGTHRGRPIEVFDLTSRVQYREDGSSRTNWRTVVLLPEAGLPAFELRPRRFHQRLLLQGIGWTKLDFDPAQAVTHDDAETVSAFIKAYTVSLHNEILSAVVARSDAGERPGWHDGSAPEQDVRRLFTPAAMRVLIQWPGWSVESYGGHLALWRNDDWFVPADERPARVAEALAIVEAVEAAHRDEDQSLPVSAGSRLSSRERLTRTQATAHVGCAGGFGGCFLGFAIFGALMVTSQNEPRPGRLPMPGPPPFFWFFPFFILGGGLIGGLIGSVIGRFAVFPIVRDCVPLARPDSPDAARRGRSWRWMAGMFLGAILGGALGMAASAALTSMQPGRPGPLVPLVFFGPAALGIFAGMTIGLILDFRHSSPRGV